MGRIKTKPMKRVTRELMDRYGDRLDTDFEKNKAVVNDVADVKCKKLRNIIAGYATRLKKSGRY